MLARIYLAIIALVWIPAGMLSFVSPERTTAAFHVAASSVAGITELRALYGGMGVALGLQALVAVFRPTTLRYALVTQSVLNLGLVVSRLSGAILFDGFPTATIAMAFFEGLSAAIPLYLLLRVLPTYVESVPARSRLTRKDSRMHGD